MCRELAYALITPHSIIKSRTGAIISRLLQANLDVVGARMLAPSDEFVDAYMAQHPGGTDPQQTQSVAVHLIVLDAVLRQNQPTANASDIARMGVELGRRRGGYPKLSEPKGWRLNVSDVVDRPYESSFFVSAVWERWAEEEPPELRGWTEGALRLLYG